MLPQSRKLKRIWKPAGDKTSLREPVTKGQTMIGKSTCQNCCGDLEFDVESTGQEIECPHCHQTTLLRAPFHAAPPKSASNPPVSRMIACPDCAHAISRDAWFCFECGRFHGNLRQIVWSVLGWAALFAAVCAIIGYLISAMFSAGQ
ncbi:MAG: hypothetical protein ACLPYZ_01225 [Limisphaerales bacterium]